MDQRGISPVLGTVLLVGLTVILAGTIGLVLVEANADRDAVTVKFDVEADAASDRISLTHQGGATLAPESLDVRVRIDETPLDHQPPIPFFSARGFHSGPTGPINAATAGAWTAGETGSFRIAGTNAPQLTEGAHVTVQLSRNGTVLAALETTAE